VSGYGGATVAFVTFGTLVIGAYGLRVSRTTSDFYVASRTVPPLWNAAAICGEYLSAASFLGVAGLVLSHGVDMLWYPVGFTAGYVLQLVLVAGPLRRSGAYTLPDFAEWRLESQVVRRLASVMVVGIGWLYMTPQLRAAGLTLATVTGTPVWAGAGLTAMVVAVNVVAGGMRSITFVQAFQFWMKLTAITVPALLMVLVFRGFAHGTPGRAPFPAYWARPLMQGEHPLYVTYGLIVALFLGVMGLPHVAVRFYTSPNARAARRTSATVVVLLGVFYLFPPVYGALGRVYAPDLASGGRADTVSLVLGGRVAGGWAGEVMTALVAGGAFAAFFAASSGLTVAMAGVISQDVLLRGGVRSFRLAAVLAAAMPFAGSLAIGDLSVATVVQMAFATTASSMCPLLVLGIWWRGLTAAGAAAGLVCGGGTALTAVLVAVSGPPRFGWAQPLLAYPAVWTVPLGFGTAIGVSLLTRRSVPAGVGRMMVRLHTPETLLRSAAAPVEGR
jgi:Na+(H+)/acetate symporter ActP